MIISILQKLFVVFLGLVTFAITVFIFVSSYEIVTQNDVPYFSSTKSYYLPTVANELGNFNSEYTPSRLVVHSSGTRLSLTPSVVNGEYINQLANRAHYFVKSEDPVYLLGDVVVYTNRSWRTIHSPESIVEGEFLSITVNEQKNTYKILEVVNKPSDEEYVVPEHENPTLVLIVINSDDGFLTYIRAIAVSKQVV